MVNIFKNQNIMNIFLLFLALTFSFVELKFEEIKLDRGQFFKLFKDQSEILKLKVLKIQETNYLKIKVVGIGEKNETNHIISYYQEEELKNRKQLSQSITNITVMWLTKQQIEKDFYLLIECAKTPCNFNLELNSSDFAELIVDDFINYYVTKENQQMAFKIKNQDYQSLGNDYYNISIWAKGNKKINSTLEGPNSLRLTPKYNIYRVNLEELKKYEYKLYINGIIGDYINVGIILFSIQSYNSELNNYKSLSYSGLEITNYLDNEIHNYIFSSEFINLGNISFPDYYKTFEVMKIWGGDKIAKNINDDDKEPIFYSILIIKNTFYDGEGNNKYLPQILCNFYTYTLNEGTKIGIIPMELDKNFKLLTYEIFNKVGEIKAYIYECENYPLCHMDKIDKTKLIKIEGYRYFYYSFKSNEWGEISPISKKQKMLLIECEKGGLNEKKDICTVSVKMKIESNIIIIRDFIKDSNPFINYIEKGQENTYLFKQYENKILKPNLPIYLNIETFSGNIDIQFISKNYTFYQYRNMKVYKFFDKEDLILKIKGLENSFYLMNNYYDGFHSFMNIGSNYLFNFEDIFDNDKVYTNIDSFQKEQHNIYNFSQFPLYIRFFPINCFINRTDFDFSPFKWYDGSYQLMAKSKQHYYEFEFKKNDNNNSCLFYSSIYHINDKSGILLVNNTSQSILFVKDYSPITFSYLHAQKDYNVNVDLNLINKGKYKINIYLNNNEYTKDIIESNKTILLKSDELIKKCANFKYVCTILLSIELQNETEINEPILYINIISNKKVNKNGKNNKIIILISIFGGVILFIFIGFIIFIL